MSNGPKKPPASKAPPSSSSVNAVNNNTHPIHNPYYASPSQSQYAAFCQQYYQNLAYQQQYGAAYLKGAVNPSALSVNSKSNVSNKSKNPAAVPPPPSSLPSHLPPPPPPPTPPTSAAQKTIPSSSIYSAPASSSSYSSHTLREPKSYANAVGSSVANQPKTTAGRPSSATNALNSSASAQKSAKNQESTPTADKWPLTLKKYVERAFSICKMESDRDWMESYLKRLIIVAHSNGDLLTRDWDSCQLPSPPSKMADFIGFEETTSNESKRKSTFDMKPAGKEKKPKNGNQIKKEIKKMDKSLVEDKLALNHRAKRFQNELSSSSSSPSSFNAGNSFQSSFPKKIESSLDDEFEWNIGAIKGQSQTVVKEYFRLTSAPDPSQVRPLEVLEKSLKHAKEYWRSKKDYYMTCRYLKSIRQDLTVQCIRNEFTVKVYETHARIALEKQDFGEFNQCQSQLKLLFREGVSGNVEEFLAYRILYFLFTGNTVDSGKILCELSTLQRKNAAIYHALKVMEAFNLRNYVQYFRLYLRTPNMGKFLLDWFLEKVRLDALKVICKAYRPHINLSYLAEILAFQNQQECLAFLFQDRKVVLSPDRENLLCKETYSLLISSETSSGN